MGIARVVPLLACFGLVGCTEAVQEWWYAGTTKGHSYCTQAGAGQKVSTTSVRAICSAKHQKDIKVEMQGKALYFDVGEYGTRKYSFKARVENSNLHYVVTSLMIVSTRGNTIDSKTFSNLWIEPSSNAELIIEADKVTPQPTEEDYKAKNFDWNIYNIRGLRIEF